MFNFFLGIIIIVLILGVVASFIYTFSVSMELNKMRATIGKMESERAKKQIQRET